MKGTITKIDARKRGNGAAFSRVYFKMEDGSWAKIDICPEYRNAKRWRGLLQPGTELDGLKMKGKDTVDADSVPFKIKKPKQIVQQEFAAL